MDVCCHTDGINTNMDAKEFEILPWDPTEKGALPVDATILIVGKRHTGKTVLTRDLMWHLKDKLDIVVGMNPTEMANHNLEHFAPKALIFHNFND
jgi:Cdc6-like AAA superfamily ATPase